MPKPSNAKAASSVHAARHIAHQLGTLLPRQGSEIDSSQDAAKTTPKFQSKGYSALPSTGARPLERQAGPRRFKPLCKPDLDH